MPENNTQIFLETRLPVNQLLFALSKRLVLQVPNLQLILATNWIIIFTIKKKKQQQIQTTLQD